jgi:hypothetical protein
MALRIKFTPINVPYEKFISNALPPEIQSQLFAEFAAQVIEEGKAHNASVLGRVPPYTVSVDGRLGAPLESVKPGGVVFVEYELVFEALTWIGDMLEQFSPVKSGRYQKSHVMIADGVAVPEGSVPPVASRITFTNVVPYSRKIERGLSPQAPDGVYQVVAKLASSKFSNVAKIQFGYETPLFGAIENWAASPAGIAWGKKKRAKGQAEWLRRQPAIIVIL